VAAPKIRFKGRELDRVEEKGLLLLHIFEGIAGERLEFGAEVRTGGL
jgi:hypothetical protein